MTDVHADTPIASPSYPPPSAVDQVKSFIGDLARPFAIYATSGAAAVASVKIAWAITDANGGAIYIGAVFVGLGALYGAKPWENSSQAKQTATIEVAKANASVGATA